MADKDFCCGKAIIRAGDDALSVRLLEYGREAYADLKKEQRVIVWIFAFFDEKELCAKCRTELTEMIEWFTKYDLFENPTRSARLVLETEPQNNLILADRGITKLPLFIYCDANGRIFDERYEFPTVKWLETNILPIFGSDASVF